MDMIYIEIGKRIRHYRLLQHFTQEDLAFEINTTAAYISNLELGKKIPSLKKLLEITEALNITANDLLYDNAYNSSSTDNPTSAFFSSHPQREQLTNALVSLLESITSDRH